MKVRFAILVLLCCYYIPSKSQNYSADTTLKRDNPSNDNTYRERIEQSIQKAITDSLFDFKIKVPDITTLYKRPIVLKEGDAHFYSSYDTSSLLREDLFLSQVELQMNWELAGVPFGVTYYGNNWSNEYKGFASIRFDRTNYLSNLKTGLKNKINPARLLNALPDPIALIKDNARAALKKELSTINAKYFGLLNKYLSLTEQSELFSKDIQSLRQQYLNPVTISSLPEKQRLIDQLRSKMNLGEHVDTVQLLMLTNSINELKGLKEIVEKIEQHRLSWQTSGLIKRIRELELLKASGLDRALSNPATIIRLAKQRFTLSGLQRLFSNVKRFNLGLNTLSSSSLSVDNYLNNGVATEFLKKKNSAVVFIGKSTEGMSIRDMPFSNTVFSNSLAKGVQLNKNASVNSFMGVSVMSFDQGFNSPSDLAGFNSYKRAMVITLNREFNLGKGGLVSTEVSRSTSVYNWNSAGKSENGLRSLLSLQDISSTTAFKVHYRNELPSAGISYQVNLKRAAIGYDNPGSPFLNQGSKEAGVGIKKSLVNKRLQIHIRSDIREFQFSQQTKWRTSSSVFDLRWKLRKGQFLSLRYLPIRTTQNNHLGKSRASVFDRLSIDGYLSRKISSRYFNNYFNVYFQKNFYNLGFSTVNNSSVGIVSTQSVAFKSFVVHFNSQVNRSNDNSGLVYFNSSFNSEFGATAMIFRSLSTTTSFGYNSIKAWYKQIGVRQTLSAKLNDRFDLSMFIDVRKNIVVLQPLLFGLVRGDISMHYRIK